MAVSKATGKWEGSLKEGKGSFSVGSGAFEGPFSFGTRFEDKPGTNPEELIGAALAGCFSMALSAGLGKAGFTPKSIETAAQVTLDKQGEGFAITQIALTTKAEVPEIDSGKFNEIAEATKAGCPVSKALTGTDIKLEATLQS